MSRTVFPRRSASYVAVDKDVTFNLTVITHDAKMESPLIELRDIVQEKVLALNATLTFYAKDMAGKRLEPVSRTVIIYCANFADRRSKGGRNHEKNHY